MNSTTHIVSTKKLTVDQIHQLKLNGIKIIHADFIKRKIQLPNELIASEIVKTIVITSKTGVKAFNEIIKRLKLNTSDYNIYCIELATQQEALKYNLRVKGVAKDADLLAEEILKDKSIQTVTFICSNIRREELPEKLRANGIKVNEVIGYHTELTPEKINENYSGVLFYSPSTIDSFLRLNKINDAVAFCIGKTTAQYAKQSGFKKIEVAEVASVNELIKTAILYYSKKSVHA